MSFAPWGKPYFGPPLQESQVTPCVRKCKGLSRQEHGPAGNARKMSEPYLRYPVRSARVTACVRSHGLLEFRHQELIQRQGPCSEDIMAPAGHRKQGRRPGGSGPRWLGAAAFVLLLATIGFGQDPPGHKPGHRHHHQRHRGGLFRRRVQHRPPGRVCPDHRADPQPHRRPFRRHAAGDQPRPRWRDRHPRTARLRRRQRRDRGPAIRPSLPATPGCIASNPEMSVRLLDRSGGRLVASETSR